MNHRSSSTVLALALLGLAASAGQTVAQSSYTPYTFTTLAGNAGYGFVDGTGSAARFYHPSGVAVDSAGNVYVGEALNHTIRKGFPTGSVSAPILLGPASLSEGQVGFHLSGLASLAVDVESSGDLSQ